MTDKQHTPGPFKAQQGAESEPDRWTIVADNGTMPFLIATIENGQPGDTVETEKYTAQLFAAAPALVAALKKSIELIKELYGWEPIEATKDKALWSGPRKFMPEGFKEVVNEAGIPPEEMNPKLDELAAALSLAKGTEVDRG